MGVGDYQKMGTSTWVPPGYTLGWGEPSAYRMRLLWCISLDSCCQVAGTVLRDLFGIFVSLC